MKNISTDMNRNISIIVNNIIVILTIYLSYMLITSGGGPEKNIEINPLGRVSILPKSLLFHALEISDIIIECSDKIAMKNCRRLYLCLSRHGIK